jgi:hypothetical protein
VGKVILRKTFNTVFSLQSFYDLMDKTQRHEDAFDTGTRSLGDCSASGPLAECTLKSSLWSDDQWSVLSVANTIAGLRHLHEGRHF